MVSGCLRLTKHEKFWCFGMGKKLNFVERLREWIKEKDDTLRKIMKDYNMIKEKD